MGMLRHLRRKAAPVALVSFASFFLAMTPVRPAQAKDGEGDDPSPSSSTPAAADTAHPKADAPAKTEATVDHARQDESRSMDGREIVQAGAEQEAAHVVAKDGLADKDMAASQSSVAPQALPTGADKTGVSSQAISVPSGAGKIQGMGESFSAQLSTGIATFNVPIALPAARGQVQPSLSLSYSSARGHGVAGLGWSIGAPSIFRQTDRGNPKYLDPDPGGDWHPEQDRFAFSDGQELVPICLVGAHGECARKLVLQSVGDQLVDEAMPS
jgi:Salmonella virulence plasmid 65kDa B protein